jgi:hypothetical protein
VRFHNAFLYDQAECQTGQQAAGVSATTENGENLDFASLVRLSLAAQNTLWLM